MPREEYSRVLQQVPVLCVDGILTNPRGEVLLVKRKNEPFKNQWWVPGGRVFKGETLEAAFRRKIREELGIDVRAARPVGYYEERHRSRTWRVRGGVHAVSVVFTARPANGRIRVDGQSSGWRFFAKLPRRLRIRFFDEGSRPPRGQ